MRQWIVQLACFYSVLLNAESTTFSADRLEAFYDQYACEEKQDTGSTGLTSGCSVATLSPTPTPPSPPAPPSSPVGPAPVTNFFPLVIRNATGQPDSEVYFLGLPNSNTEFFVQSVAFPGAMTTTPITTTTFSASFCIPLSSLQPSTTGAHDYLIYVPFSNSDRIYFSIGSPLYFPTAAGSISPSIGNSFNDPNYNVIYDFAEISYASATPPMAGEIPWTVTLDTTQVDSLALSIALGFYSYDPANPSTVTPWNGGAGTPATNPVGFSISRDTLFTNIVSGLTSGSASGTWANLALPFFTDPYNPTTPAAYLRVMAPKHGGTVVQPQPNYSIPVFPSTYLTNNGNGVNYLNTIFNFYSGSTHLYIQPNSGGGSGQIYQGVVSGSAGSYVFTFTSTTDVTNIVTLNESGLTIEQMFSGTPPMTGSGSTPAPDIGIIKDLFGSAFVVGLLGVTGLYNSLGVPLNEANLQSHLPHSSGTLTPTYYTNNFASPSTSKPGYDLYAQLLHENAILPTSPPFNSPYPTLGLCYGYDFDDTLGFSSAITPPATTPTSDNVYAIITLGQTTNIPTGVFDDSNTYNLTFTFSTGTFGWRQGSSGSFTPASTGFTINSVTSTSANPFQIQYNGSIFTVFPKYQFLQPFSTFTNVEQGVINASSITPNSMTSPTGFTIHLAP